MKQYFMKQYFIINLLFFLGACSLDPSLKEDRRVYYVHNKGASLPVVIAGVDSKDIILFVHGGPGSSGLLYYYAEAWKNVRKTYKMVFYDQRGSGGGRGHISKKSLTVDQHVEDLDIVLESVKSLYPHANIYLFGHSYGGMIAGAYTTVHQDKLKGLMLLSPALNIVDLSTRIPSYMIKQFIDPYLARTDISQKSRDEWEKIKKFYQDNNPLKLDSFITHNSYVNKADPIQGLDKFDTYYDYVLPILLQDPLLEPIIWLKQMQLMLPILDANQESQRNLETDPKFNLKNITIPALLIVGNQDLVVPKDSSIQAFNTISSTTTKTIKCYDHSSHNAFLEHPQKMTQDVINFIKANNKTPTI